MSPLTEQDELRSALARLADTTPPASRTDLDAASEAWAARPAEPSGLIRRLPVVRPLVTVPLLVAAVVILVAMLASALPLLSEHDPQPAEPFRGPVGLPSRWWTPPAWTPSVTEQPIERASALLAVPGMYPAEGSSRPGVVLVSADGREYRRLPWRYGDAGASRAPGEQLAVLSPDGRRVAWVELRARAGSEWPEAHLHVLALATARDAVRRLDTGSSIGDAVQALNWSGDGRRLLVTAGPMTKAESDAEGTSVESVLHLYLVDPAGRTEQLCTDCGYGTYAPMPDGRFVGVGVESGPVDGIVNLPEDKVPDDVAPIGGQGLSPGATGGSSIAALPDGSGWVGLAHDQERPDYATWQLGVVRRDGSRVVWQILIDNEVTEPQVLAATRTFALVAVHRQSPDLDAPPSRDDLLRVDLATGAVTEVGFGHGGALLGGVAADLAASGAVVAGTEPTWPWYQPERLSALVAGVNWTVLGLVLLAAATGLLLSRRRRRTD